MTHRMRVVCAVLTAAAWGTTLIGQSPAISSPGISNGYITGPSKVGINDSTYAGHEQFREARFARFQSLGATLKLYPADWRGFEAADIPSSTDENMACPAGFVRVPQNQAERIARGYFKFRCMNEIAILRGATVFQEDRERGMESAVYVYSAPVRYRPACVPATWGTNQAFDNGCVPADTAMEDFEDYVNFLAHYYNGVNDAGQDDGSGKITHVIVWNEFQSGRWFNYSERIPWWEANPSAYVNALAEKYRDMLVRTHRAFGRHRTVARPAVMLYVSLDAQVNQSPGTLGNPNVTPPIPAVPYHMSTQVALEGLWSKLGTSIDWSIAIHPYGDPTAKPTDSITYARLGELIEYQKQTLVNLGVSNPLNRPQTFVFPNEQGWPNPPVEHSTRAIYMCQAHAISLTLPTVLPSTHSTFQVGQDCHVNPPTVHQDLYGLIPASAACDLSQIESWPVSEEWLAYKSMAPWIWGNTSDNWCCGATSKGCVQGPIGAVGPVTFENGEWVLKGWACSPGANQSIDVHLYGNGPAGAGGTYAGAFTANRVNEPEVSAACQSSGKTFRFRIPLTPWLAYHGVRLYVHGISPFGAGNPLLSGSGSYAIP